MVSSSLQLVNEGGRGNTKKLFRNNQNKKRVLMQTTVAKGVAMSKFCSDPNKNAIFFIFMKVLTEKIFEYDKGENKDHIFSIFQIWQNLQFYKKILCKTTLSLLLMFRATPFHLTIFNFVFLLLSYPVSVCPVMYLSTLPILYMHIVPM